jgi:hypothetical protein
MKPLILLPFIAWAYLLITEEKPKKVTKPDPIPFVACDCCLPAQEPDIECFTRQQAWNSITAQYRQSKAS